MEYHENFSFLDSTSTFQPSFFHPRNFESFNGQQNLFLSGREETKSGVKRSLKTSRHGRVLAGSTWSVIVSANRLGVGGQKIWMQTFSEVDGAGVAGNNITEIGRIFGSAS